MNENFSVRRLWLLLRSDAVAGYRSLTLVSAALAGMIFVTAMIALNTAPVTEGFYVSWFGAMLFIWGVIASSRAFRELHDKTRNEAYLLIPASSGEKTIARLLAVTVGLATYLLIFTSITSLLVETLNLLLFGQRNVFFNPFDPFVWALVPSYIFVQSLYFLGAAWFRKTHLIKTTLAITLAAIGLALISLIFFLTLFAPYWGNIGDVELVFEELAQSFHGLLQLIELLVELGLPIACWFIACLRVKETQVSDGV